MKYCIDDRVVKKCGFTLPEFFLTLVIKTGQPIEKILNGMIDKSIVVDQDGELLITQHWNDICESVLFDSDPTIPTTEDLFPFAQELMALMPPGKMPGSPYYWKCNKREVALKLQKFFKLYGNEYSKEEIKEAVRRYVESFHGDYRYMRLLKYIIWKKLPDGEEVSDLATFLESGKDDTTVQSNNWLNDLR